MKSQDKIYTLKYGDELEFFLYKPSDDAEIYINIRSPLNKIDEMLCSDRSKNEPMYNIGYLTALNEISENYKKYINIKK